MNITKDGGKTWRFIGNLPVAQFYHINIDNEFPYNVYGGMQDNGSWRGPAYVWRAQGIRNSYWQEISFGDGFDVVPDLDDSRYGWTMSQQGSVSRYDWQTGNNYSVKPTHPEADVKLRFNWNSAINIDPFDNNTIYFGSQFVHKSTDKGLTWTLISPDLTTNDPEKLKQHESGGLSMDATGAENHCTVLVIEPSPIEKDMIWAGTDDGRVHFTQNGGATWTDVSANIKGLPAGSWIPQIKASNKNKGEALLVANDYRRFNYTPYVYRTKDYGKTWTRIVDGDDVESYALSIVEDIEEPNLMFLGTDDGLYISVNAGQKWIKWTEGFPTVSVKDLIIHPREHDLIIGTFGRAAWVLDNIRPLRAIAKNNNVLSQKLELFDPPTAYQASYQQPTGSRFGGDALFNGQNRGSGAQLAYYIQIAEKKKEESKDEAKKKTKKDKKKCKKEDVKKPTVEDTEDSDEENVENKIKWDSIHMKIYDGDRLIRTLKRKAPKESGVHNWTWRMDEKGGDRPSRTIKEKKSESGGASVKPGTYRVTMSFGDQTSETMVTVKTDPRIEVSTKAINDAYNASKEIQSIRQTAADAVKQLVESKTIASDYSKKLTKLDKKKYKDQIEASKDIIKKLDEVLAIYLGKEDKRQGITSDPTVNVSQRIGTAGYYSGSRPNGLTSTELTLIKHAKNALKGALDKTNTFFNEEWKPYRETIEKLNISPFKNVKSFELKDN